MAIGVIGLNAMIDGIGQQATLYLGAYSATGGTTLEATGTVTFVAGGTVTDGVADIVSNVVLAIGAGKTITKVRLQTSTASSTDALTLANVALSAYFPDGGDLIIESYEMTVTST